MLTIEPPAVISGTIAWIPSIALVRFVRSTRSQSSSVTSSSRARQVIARVVDEPVDASVLALQPRRGRVQSLGLGHVETAEHDSGRRRLERVLDVGGHDGRPFGGERRGLGGALAARGAGDDHDLAVDSAHLCSSGRDWPTTPAARSSAMRASP